MADFFRFNGKCYMTEAADWKHQSKVVVSEDGEIVFRMDFSSGALDDFAVSSRFVARELKKEWFDVGEGDIAHISGDYDLPDGARGRMDAALEQIYGGPPEGTVYDWDKECWVNEDGVKV